MLNLMRSSKKVIIWIVVISFGGWGAYSAGLQLQKQYRIAGEINGKGVSYQEYLSFEKATALLSQAPFEQDPDLLRQVTWQNIIYSREAKRLGIQVSDDEVKKQVETLFAPDSSTAFDKRSYEIWVERRFRDNPRQFEEKIREWIRIQKMLSSLPSPKIEEITDAEIKEAFNIKHSSVTGSYKPFPNRESAENHLKELKTSPALWKQKQGDKQTAQTIEIKNKTLMELGQTLRLNPEELNTLFNLPENEFSSPIQTPQGFLIVNLSAKTAPDVSLFEKEKKEIAERVLKSKKYQYFVQWNNQLIQRANLKDYISELKR